jgi:hypothetical protein
MGVGAMRPGAERGVYQPPRITRITRITRIKRITRIIGNHSEEMYMIKAIETRYKGYRFRSRLEARWAVFLDSMNCKWFYELQGFNLNGERYLPDFWLPEIEDRPYPAGTPPVAGFWLEVKPCPLNDREEGLCRLLSEQSGHVVYAVAGNVGLDEFWCYKFHPSGYFKLQKELEKYTGNAFLFYFISTIAARVYPGDTWNFEGLSPAFQAARSARFEHGETPR